MNLGKIPETVLKRSVLNQIAHRRDEVLVGPAIGEDCSVLAIAEDEALVISTDPITGTVKDIGTLAVHITANDIASNGAEVIGIMLTILLPDGFEEAELRGMMSDIETVCKQLNLEVIGGHTEITKAVNQPIVTVTGVGKIKRDSMIKTAGAKPGQEIVMTKWAGLEGTAIIAAAKEEELRSKYSADFINGAKRMIEHISVVPDSKIARSVGVTSMHDVTEGGIFGALWEIGAASKVGLEVDLRKILLRQETVEICEFYDLNPYMLISSGCMLIITDQANYLVDCLKAEGIPAAVIGRITQGNDRIIINEEERRFLEPPKSDELYKVM
ncbi:hydrogenase maturation factor [Lachnospiraceae bacterium MD1]|uniref:Hydrogenase maturation factor n=1 Tax=Variimorphobacter saccharofermentans TaxID=2755051 RepID=A0A839K3S1_9FIRM|nr:AIR synthase family protein [Variimorphobacter saccharofermentans]MBB2184514.1 hydrogenase maturation factor [Variimorphobacter saccharofermentans]